MKSATDKDADEKKRQKNYDPFQFMQKESRKEKFQLFSDAGANGKANSSDLNKTYCDMFCVFLGRTKIRKTESDSFYPTVANFHSNSECKDANAAANVKRNQSSF